PLIGLAKTSIDSLLIDLSSFIENKDQYVEQKLEKLTVLKSIAANSAKNKDLYYQYSVYSELYAEYKSFKYDSAFTYAKRMLKIAHKLNNTEIIVDAKINMSFILLSSGFFQQSIDTLKTIAPDPLPTTLKVKYYKTLNRAWIDFADYTQDNHYTPIYNAMGNKALLSAIEACDSNLPEFSFLNGLYCLRINDKSSAKIYYEKLWDNTTISKHERAILASTLSYIYGELNEVDKSIEFLIKAAKLDIQVATKETVALINLAEILFNRGMLDLSLLCVNQALEDANYYGAKHRIAQISNILPIIEGSMLRTKEKQREIFMLFSIVLGLSVIGLMLLAYTVTKQNRKLVNTKRKLSSTIESLRNTNKELSEVNRIKEEYIGHFFELISSYIGKIEKLKKSVSRNLMLSKLSEVEKIMSNIDLRMEREELYASFDSIFVKLFPRFIGRYNSHVGEVDKVSEGKSHAFTPELRIYALKRLGINDNETIARFLGYSVTTIYTYKTKLKKRCPNPDANLDEVLMTIQME
ncbi:MAG: DUF6377 domain-containing protein, partial [Salinivirgaceae bacterium]|nr:DUF6377 domain-containing protein [Salinivirgaceae bacterium]